MATWHIKLYGLGGELTLHEVRGTQYGVFGVRYIDSHNRKLGAVIDHIPSKMWVSEYLSRKVADNVAFLLDRYNTKTRSCWYGIWNFEDITKVDYKVCRQCLDKAEMEAYQLD